jgi:uncharacterized membrane protein
MDEYGPRSDTRRAEAFSDAVFAIVITLLVLDLHPPEAAQGQLLQGLLNQWPTYLAYVTSYAYVAVVWLNHKAAFRRIRYADRGLHWANLGILFTTALLPFPTAVVSNAVEEGNGADIRTAVALYALVGALLSLSWLVFFHYLAVREDLVEESVMEGYFRAERTRAGPGGSGVCGGGSARICRHAVPAADDLSRAAGVLCRDQRRPLRATGRPWAAR